MVWEGHEYQMGERWGQFIITNKFYIMTNKKPAIKKRALFIFFSLQYPIHVL
jgi:hypothetical protein